MNEMIARLSEDREDPLEIEYISLEDCEDRLQELIWVLETMRRKEAGLREAFQKLIFTQQTIMPGGNYSGIIICDTSDLDFQSEVKFRIVISVDGEEHAFTLHWGA